MAKRLFIAVSICTRYGNQTAFFPENQTLSEFSGNNV